MSRHQARIQFGVVAGALLLSLAPTVASAQDPLENAPMAPQSAARGDEGTSGSSDSTSQSEAKAKPKPRPEFINKTHAEWRGMLSKLQFAVTREKATEPPFTGKYSSGHFKGTFVCACCDAAHVQSELFSSLSKFDSGTGWPSFYQPFDNRAIQTTIDHAGLESRVEVMCRRCGAHLGHVFDDGPPPTGLRFCINSAALKLNSSEVETSPRRVASKAAAKSKAKAKAKDSAKDAPKPIEPRDPLSPADPERAAPTDDTKGASSAPSP